MLGTQACTAARERPDERRGHEGDPHEQRHTRHEHHHREHQDGDWQHRKQRFHHDGSGNATATTPAPPSRVAYRRLPAPAGRPFLGGAVGDPAEVPSPPSRSVLGSAGHPAQVAAVRSVASSRAALLSRPLARPVCLRLLPFPFLLLLLPFLLLPDCCPRFAPLPPARPSSSSRRPRPPARAFVVACLLLPSSLPPSPGGTACPECLSTAACPALCWVSPREPATWTPYRVACAVPAGGATHHVSASEELTTCMLLRSPL